MLLIIEIASAILLARFLEEEFNIVTRSVKGYLRLHAIKTQVRMNARKVKCKNTSHLIKDHLMKVRDPKQMQEVSKRVSEILQSQKEGK